MDARTVLALIPMAGWAILLGGPGLAQAPGKPVFAAPVRLKAGDAYLGQGRLYPSPVLHDMDGDRQLDILVGDLVGRVTVARRVAAEGGLRVQPETPLTGRNGKPLKFHNW